MAKPRSVQPFCLPSFYREVFILLVFMLLRNGQSFQPFRTTRNPICTETCLYSLFARPYAGNQPQFLAHGRAFRVRASSQDAVEVHQGNHADPAVISKNERSNELAENNGKNFINDTGSDTGASLQITSSPVFRTRRKQKQKRKPRNYWKDIDNVESELRQFWDEVGLPRPPPNLDVLIIPNESLLNYYEKFSLRHGIAQQGGRKTLAMHLHQKYKGETRLVIMPGRWKQAVESSRALQYIIWKQQKQRQSNLQGKPVNGTLAIIPAGKEALSRFCAPLSPQQLARQKKKAKDNNGAEVSDTKGSSSTTAPYGYWQNQEIVYKELRAYLQWCQETTGRPARWLPLLNEMDRNGRADLMRALRSIPGGTAEICRRENLVPRSEWIYFERQFILLKLLVRYLDEHCGGRDDFFPYSLDIMKYCEENDSSTSYYRDLYSLLYRIGGRKFVARRLGMNYRNEPKWYKETIQHRKPRERKTKVNSQSEINFGRFSLRFALKLTQYIRDGFMLPQQSIKLSAPAETSPITQVIEMPTQDKLIADGFEDLAKQVEEFGGRESVARRLGLYF